MRGTGSSLGLAVPASADKLQLNNKSVPKLQFGAAGSVVVALHARLSSPPGCSFSPSCVSHSLVPTHPSGTSVDLLRAVLGNPAVAPAGQQCLDLHPALALQPLPS